MNQKKPKKKRRFLRLFLTFILLVVILLLFGERLGLGTGDYLSLISPTPAAEPVAEPAPETPQDKAQEIEITISDTAIQVDGETYTRDTFAAYLLETDENTLFVLSDQQANYALFKEVEDLLKSKNLPYVIEE